MNAKFSAQGRILFALLSAATVHCNTVSIWVRAHDNPNDYILMSMHESHSEKTCILAASTRHGAQLVTYSSLTGLCSEYKCGTGPMEDCRKCRNSHAANQVVWLRDSDGSTMEQCWITVQHRVSASVDFYRNWSDYKVGFGDGPSNNFWIGLDTIHSLTNPSARKLRFLMKLWNDSESWAQYSNFSIGPESDDYRLRVSGFSGSPGIGDSLQLSNDMRFSTKDRDNDFHDHQCAHNFKGGWWFNMCFKVHPNGPFVTFPAALSVSFAGGIIWKDPYGYYYSLREIEMLVK